MKTHSYTLPPIDFTAVPLFVVSQQNKCYFFFNINESSSVELFAFDPQVDAVSSAKMPEIIQQTNDTSGQKYTLAFYNK